MDIIPQSNLLEIGFGNGMHVPYIFDKESSISYYGIEISEAMVEDAMANNSSLIDAGRAKFQLAKEADFSALPDASFHNCFSVNTLYFWHNPVSYFQEINRILEPEGQITIGYIAKTVGTKLSFTQSGFTFYEEHEVEAFLEQAGFYNICSSRFTEEAISKDGQPILRTFCIVTARAKK